MAAPHIQSCSAQSHMDVCTVVINKWLTIQTMNYKAVENSQKETREWIHGVWGSWWQKNNTNTETRQV